MRPSTLPPVSSFANHPHGTRVRYMAGCKCMFCRAANSRYEVSRAAARRRGEHGYIIEAGRARRHIRKLGRQGVGYKSVAAAADVGKTIVFQIRNGTRQRIRATTERRILAVDALARADASLVPARKAQGQLRALFSEGYTKTFLARELGSKAKTPALQLRRDFITAKNEAKVERLHRRLMQ